MVWVRCKFCNYEHDYKGTKILTKCPHCEKHMNLKKSTQLYAQYHTQDGKSKGGITPQNNAMAPDAPEFAGSSDSPLPAARESSIVMENVEINVPPELQGQEPELKDELKKAGQPAKPQEKVDFPYKTVEVFVEMPFIFWANVEKDDAYRLEKQERDQLVPMVKQYLDAHMGAWFAGYSSEIALAIVLGMVIIRRVGYKAQQEAKRRAKAPLPAPDMTKPENIPTPAETAKPDWMEGGFATRKEEKKK